jgi:hypothetical protein
LKSAAHLPFFVFFLFALVVRAADLPLDEQHPAVLKARLYVQAIVARDWPRCAALLLPAALERRQRDALAAFDTANEKEQQGFLAFYGVKSRAELAALSPQKLYVADRTATYRALDEVPDALARELATLDLHVLSIASEENNEFLHVLIRTHREADTKRIHELMLVSVVRDTTDATRWFVAPDSLLPVAEPLRVGPRLTP